VKKDTRSTKLKLVSEVPIKSNGSARERMQSVRAELKAVKRRARDLGAQVAALRANERSMHKQIVQLERTREKNAAQTWALGEAQEVLRWASKLTAHELECSRVGPAVERARCIERAYGAQHGKKGEAHWWRALALARRLPGINQYPQGRVRYVRESDETHAGGAA
jgi:hypothetical protein